MTKTSAIVAIGLGFSMALAGAAADGSPTVADDDMQALYVEYREFKGTAEFRRFGYRARGPFWSWSERIQKLHHRPGYAMELFARCHVVPLDLWNVGIEAFNGETTTWRTDVEEKFAACFGR